jgi:hypothetical protein
MPAKQANPPATAAEKPSCPATTSSVTPKYAKARRTFLLRESPRAFVIQPSAVVGTRIPSKDHPPKCFSGTFYVARFFVKAEKEGRLTAKLAASLFFFPPWRPHGRHFFTLNLFSRRFP